MFDSYLNREISASPEKEYRQVIKCNKHHITVTITSHMIVIPECPYCKLEALKAEEKQSESTS